MSTGVIELQSIISKSADQGNVVGLYSIDLSSAFDVLRAGTFDKIMTGKISLGLRHVIINFLTERKILIEVNGLRSEEQSLDIECVQGLTFGLFSLYQLKYKMKLMQTISSATGMTDK